MRIAIAAIAGYISYFVWIAASFSGLWLATGPSFAFHSGSTNVTAGWLIAATGLNLAGAWLAGLVAYRIARRDTRAVVALAMLVVTLGITVAVMNKTADRSLPAGKTPATLSAMEAGQFAIQPTWYDFLIPMVAAVGVMVGGYRTEQRSASFVTS